MARYLWVADDAFRAGRRGVLESFLSRTRIFLHSAHADAEPHARANLQRELSSL